MMRPLYNSFPRQPQQQGFQSNYAAENQCNNNINMLTMQCQMGSFNPQPSMPMGSNVGFINGGHPPFPTQNNHLGIPQFGPISPNLNNVSMLPQLHGQFNNTLQNPNQPNWLNLAQHINQSNVNLMNGQQQQLFLQSQLSQLLNAQINLSQFVSGIQTMGSLNSIAGPSNPLFGFMQQNRIQQANQSQQNLADLSLSSAAPSLLLGDPSFGMPMGDPGKTVQNFNNFPGRNAARFQKSEFQQSRFHRENNGKGKFKTPNRHKEKGQDKTKVLKFPSTFENSDKEKKRSLALTYTEQEIQKWREERKKYYPTKSNIKKKLSGKVADAEATKSLGEQLKEILAKQAELGVEVAEIPAHYFLDSQEKVNGSEEKSRLSIKRGRFETSHDKAGGRFEMRHDKVERFEARHDKARRFETRNDKTGRFDKRGRFSKKRRLRDEESFSSSSIKKRSPTLLQKLLSADIRRDKSRLLQVFRFMVINSFFKDLPEKPLKFPLVVVKDGEYEDKTVQEKNNIEVCNKTMIQSIVDGDSNDNNEDGNGGENCSSHTNDDDNVNNYKNCVNNEEDDDDELDNRVDQVGLHVMKKADIVQQVKDEEEEGEIID